MTQKKTPTGLNRQGQQEKSRTDREDNTVNPLAGQGFCAPCPYFRAVKLAFGRVRRVSAFSGERLPLAGKPLCEFQTVQEVADA